MGLKADQEGFLIGEPITIDTGSFAKAASIWRQIRSDTEAIRKALAGHKPGGQPAKATPRATVASPRRAASPDVAAAGARAGSSASPRRSEPAPGSPPAEAGSERSRRAATATPTRDARGRFVGGGRQSSGGDSPAPPDDTRRDPPDDEPRRTGFARRLLGDVVDAAKSGVSQTAQGTENIDPALSAAREVGGIVGPLLKPVATLMGGIFGKRGERKKRKDDARENAREQHRLALPWYKRMLRGRPPAGAADDSFRIAKFIPLLLGAAPVLLAMLAGLIPIAIGAVGALITGAVISKALGTTTEEYAKRMGVELNGSLVQELGVRFVGVLGDLGNTITFGLAGKFGEYLSEKTDAVTADPTSWVNSALNFVKGASGRKGELEEAMTSSGITNPSERAMLLAQADHETGGFRNMEESFKYSPDRLRSTSSRARDLSAGQMADLLKSGEQGVANFMYGGRLGNNKEGDGFRYRGRGFVQLTGKANYAEAGKALGLDLLGDPDLAANPQVAAKIATWYYSKKGLASAARAGDVEAVTRGINGGSNGLTNRKKLYEQYRAELGGKPVSPSVSSPIGSIKPMGASATPGIHRMSVATSSAAPRIDRFTPGKAPELLSPIGNADRGKQNIQVTVPMPISQNLGDRQIAQFATGGIGGVGQ